MGAAVQLHRSGDRMVCPWTQLRKFLELRGWGSGVLFVHEDGRPVLDRQVLGVLRSCLQSLGLAALEFGKHSFCIGTALEGFQLGMTEDKLKGLGKWKSKCVLQYVQQDIA